MKPPQTSQISANEAQKPSQTSQITAKPIFQSAKHANPQTLELTAKTSHEGGGSLLDLKDSMQPSREPLQTSKIAIVKAQKTPQISQISANKLEYPLKRLRLPPRHSIRYAKHAGSQIPSDRFKAALQRWWVDPLHLKNSMRPRSETASNLSGYRQDKLPNHAKHASSQTVSYRCQNLSARSSDPLKPLRLPPRQAIDHV